jgi:hypothetical protein
MLKPGNESPILIFTVVYVTLRSIRRNAKWKTVALALSLPVFQPRCPEIAPKNASTVGRIFLTITSTPSAVGCRPSA